MQQISIDLVIDEVPLQGAELITPADRMDIVGLGVCDYLAFPVENTLADKLCALIEMHNGRPSTRVKDLVDIMVYATTHAIDRTILQERIHREAAVRGLTVPRSFTIPEAWGDSQEKQLKKLCFQTGLSNALRTISSATRLVGALFDPALEGHSDNKSWNPHTATWET